MALNDEGGSGIPATMLVGPASYGQAAPYPVYMGGQGGGNGGFGDGGWWIVLVIIILAALGGNWGGNNGGGAFGGQPIIVNDGGNGVQRGFDQAATMAGLTGIQGGISALSTQLCSCCCDMQGTVNNGFANVQQSLCSGFAGVNASINGAQSAISNQLYNNEIASLNRSFAEQTANTAGFTGVQSGLCDIRYGSATNTRDIIENQTRGTQLILDKLCSLELDAKNTKIADLERQLTMANLAASQTAQTAQIRDGQVSAVTALVNELRSCPIPAQPVYGSQPIFTCPNNNNGCGCGCGGNF